MFCFTSKKSSSLTPAPYQAITTSIASFLTSSPLAYPAAAAASSPFAATSVIMDGLVKAQDKTLQQNSRNRAVCSDFQSFTWYDSKCSMAHWPLKRSTETAVDSETWSVERIMHCMIQINVPVVMARLVVFHATKILIIDSNTTTVCCLLTAVKLDFFQRVHYGKAISTAVKLDFFQLFQLFQKLPLCKGNLRAYLKAECRLS